MAQKNERRQAREKLRAFYKIAPTAENTNKRSTLPTTPSGLKQQTDTIKDRTTKKRTTHDIDGSGFDAKKYLKKLLESQGVVGLLQADNQLVREVRQIDGAMKTMVYENYSRFIRATQAIQQMKRDADHMDAEMAKLTQRVDAIAIKGTAVNDAFAQRRENIQRLSREHRALGGLQFLFALPMQLNRLIGAARFVEAAQLWSRTRPLLAHYRRLGLFEAVAEDGREIMASVEATVWARWNDSETGIAEGAECASLLVLLRPERAKELWREYLTIQSAKNCRLRQQALDQACQLPPVASAEPFGPRAQPDPSGAPLPAAAAAAAQTATGPHGATEYRTCTNSRIAQFNEAYLPAWSSLVIGFASQFLSPAGSGLLERAGSAEEAETAEAETPAGRTRSLLEATTEGTVVGLLSPLAGVATTQQRAVDGDAVVGWQAMDATELAAAQQAFGEHVAEWAAEYEFIADNLLQQPDDPAAADVVPFLQQLDALAAATAQHPILVRIGGLRDCVLRVAAHWQRRLVDTALQAVVRDMLERLEYYFDPAADPPADIIDVSCGAQSSAPPPPPPRGSGAAARHQRNLSVRSSASLASGDAPAPRAPSTTWSAGAPRDAAVSPQSPLAAQTSARGRAHARAVSSAFEALGNAPPPIAASGSWTRRSTSGWSIRRSRTLSGVFGEPMIEAPYDDDTDSLARRGIPRRYRPWLVWSVNRSAPLHVLLAETEAWLIQQVLERVNPLLERVVQHHLDVEASQLLDEGRTATDPPTEQLLLPPPQTSAALRHSFVQALDSALDAWMSRSIPDAFLHAAMARPPLHGTRVSVERRLAESPMAQLGVAAISDPVVSLLLARFAVDFGLTLAQSIYQLCEHSISILPDDAATPSRPPLHSAGESAANLLIPNKDASDQRLSSITAASAHRTDSLASGSRRATLAANGRQNPVSLLTLRHADHTVGWHSAAERLVRNFVMTVGREISAEYLAVHPYASQEKESEDDAQLPVSVSGVWLSICRWMRQVEDDTNALFHDPVFSATLSALNKSRFSNSSRDDSTTTAAVSADARYVSAPATPATVRKQQSSSAHHPPTAVGNAASALHAHILSNIDRLFAERVDVFPQSVSPLNSGRILFHLAMQIVKTAVESLRLRAPVFSSRRQFFQLLVDIAFVRSWMLRYAGVHPDFIAVDGRHPSSSSSSATPTTVNERDARAVQNLIDDWIASAKACAIENDQFPDRSLFDTLVLNAWMHAYFNRDVCA
ncbi:hypothetical protein H4R24_001894 [Coemansia sp. RSA 988]|nr:hypothetical protein H4R24_001894 [Coemansia sp. RSA 988]